MPQKPLSFDEALADVVGPSKPPDASKPSGPLSFDEALNSIRADGTPKGGGFFGTLERPDGKVSTELSIGVDFDGKETEIPLLVPSLTQKEVDTLLALPEKAKTPDAIANKAVAYAKLRMQAGKPVFAEPSEVGKFKPLPFAFKGIEQRRDRPVIAASDNPAAAETEGKSIGLGPEVVGPGALAISRAVVEPGLTAAGRALAGARSLAGGAIGATVKGEAAYYALKGLGLPEPVATIGAILAGRGRGGKGATTAAETAAAETVAAETTPMGFPKSEPQLTPREFTALKKRQWQTITGQKKLPAPEGSVAPKVAPEAVEPEMKAVLKPTEAAKTVEAAKAKVGGSAEQMLEFSVRKLGASDEMVQKALEHFRDMDLGEQLRTLHEVSAELAKRRIKL